MNPNMSVHKAYNAQNLPEYTRIALSRLRLGSHWLKIETGRWARIDQNMRLCPCGLVQDEEHITCFCPLTQCIRDQYKNLPFMSLANLMASCQTTEVAMFVFKVLNQADIINNRS